MFNSRRFTVAARAAAMLVAVAGAGAARAEISSPLAEPEAADTIYINAPSNAERDRQLTQQVAAVLASDPWLKSESIAVSTRGGVLRLSGQLSSVSMIYRAIEKARTVPGVSRINDNELM